MSDEVFKIDTSKLTDEQLKSLKNVCDASLNIRSAKVINTESELIDPKVRRLVRTEFDGAGGDKLYSQRQLNEAILINNGPKWEQAKKESQAEYGELRWPFIMYLYEKMGGKK